MTEFDEAYHHLDCAYKIFKKNSLDKNSMDIKKIQRTKEIQRLTSLLNSLREVVLDFTRNEEQKHDTTKHD